MNIVVYGCDNTGKTTLCNKIKEYFGNKAVILKSPGPVSTEVQEYFLDTITNWKWDDERIAIYDRFPVIEEKVCGVILRGINNLAGSPSALKASNSIDLFIKCKPPLSTVLQWGTREQMDGIKENVEKLYYGYDEVKEYLHNVYMVDEEKFITYNYMSDTLESIIHEIERRM